ncbi:hypothetical protein [Deinococcus aestuarii]|uniref:hypothetical protein n=1 Tax=Deinococcus aestuarii TaxID=2774531 RepID=UPI001C0CF0E4|nr:hypothetical protein [Deinococcus aestuarii]
MAKFIKLEDGSDVNAIHRIHLEKHTDPRFWKLNAQFSKPKGGAKWSYLAGEFGSLKEAVRKFGK